jgi:glycosyltransferase involved in cell wall biosynthesis
MEVQLHALASGLHARGHDIEVLTSFPGPPQVDGIRVRRLPVARVPGAKIAALPGTHPVVRRALADGGFDLVHVHVGLIVPLAYHALVAATAQGLPTVATVHSVWRHFAAPLRLVGRAVGMPRRPVRWTAVSPTVASHMQPLVGTARIDLLPNGIDRAWWGRTACDAAAEGDPWGARAPGEVRVVSVMRLQPRKRGLALVRAFARAHAMARRQGVSLRLRLVGDGVEAAPVRWLAAWLGVADAVTVTGWLPPGAVRATLRHADIFALASQLEAFGIAALEARACGLPVVARQGSGPADFLGADRDGWLVRDDAELAIALGTLATDAARRERLAAGPTPALESSDWSVVLDAHERCYEAAMHR